MSWTTIIVMAVFGMSLFLAFERKGRTKRMIMWRLVFVVSSVLLCFYPIDLLRPFIGTFLAISFTLGYGVLCALVFWGLLHLIRWILGIQIEEIYDFLLGSKSSES